MNNTTIGRLWRGEIALHETFWRYTIAYGLLINAITSISFLILIANDQAIPALVLGYVVSLPCNLFLLIALWRSADRYRGARSTARFMQVAGAVWILLLSVT